MIKKAILRHGSKLLSDPRVAKLMSDERVMKAIVKAMGVPGKVESFGRGQVERIAKAMALATQEEVLDLRRTVRKLEDELARLRRSTGSTSDN